MKNPFPELIHDDDVWMIKQSDIDFVRKRASAVSTIAKQDDAFRMAAFMQHLDEGKSQQEAGRLVRKSFAMFYYAPADRSGDWLVNDDDAYLPFMIKARLGPFKLLKIGRKAGQYSSFNACIRDLARQGKL